LLRKTLTFSLTAQKAGQVLGWVIRGREEAGGPLFHKQGGVGGRQGLPLRLQICPHASHRASDPSSLASFATSHVFGPLFGALDDNPHSR
jgi:hypothetical protein